MRFAMLCTQAHQIKDLSPVDTLGSGHTVTEHTTFPEHLTAFSLSLVSLRGRQLSVREHWAPHDRYEGAEPIVRFDHPYRQLT